MLLLFSFLKKIESQDENNSLFIKILKGHLIFIDWLFIVIWKYVNKITFNSE